MGSRSLALLTAVAALGCATTESVKLLVAGDTREIYERPEDAPPSSPHRPALLVIALDGVDRDLLYQMLEKNELPEFGKLLSGKNGKFEHAYFDDSFLSTLPSSTAVAWVTAFTGATPAQHGVAGNEFFIRETRQFAAPVPVTFSDASPVLATYTDGYVNKLCQSPTVYERMRERDPNVLVWVAMHQLHRGADTLLMTDRAILADAFKSFLQQEIANKLAQKDSKALYATLDEQVIDSIEDEIEEEDKAVPDVLTVYLSGTDQFAHVAEVGPDKARREYLIEEVDPLMKRLHKAMAERDALSNRYVVVTSDHGHTEVVDDDDHALATDDDDDPPAVLRKAGFRLRPFKLDVSNDADFDSVIAYQGAMAYVYVADRSTCPKKGQRCDFARPARFEKDVLALADAFYEANRSGKYAAKMKGTLDMILARKPRPVPEVDAPFEVYVGDGELVPIAKYLAAHPHPTYVALAERLRDLAVGPAGERAGDVLLIANNGNKDTPKERYYFSSRYHSWHGSPSKQDSEIPLIVAHPQYSTDQLRVHVKRALGAKPYQQKFTELLLDLRLGEPSKRAHPAAKAGARRRAQSVAKQ